MPKGKGAEADSAGKKAVAARKAAPTASAGQSLCKNKRLECVTEWAGKGKKEGGVRRKAIPPKKVKLSQQPAGKALTGRKESKRVMVSCPEEEETSEEELESEKDGSDEVALFAQFHKWREGSITKSLRALTRLL